ncbi:hypothetical protein V8G54_026069, partial [Vigna mungo]
MLKTRTTHKISVQINHKFIICSFTYLACLRVYEAQKIFLFLLLKQNRFSVTNKTSSNKKPKINQDAKGGKKYTHSSSVGGYCSNNEHKIKGNNEFQNKRLTI